MQKTTVDGHITHEGQDEALRLVSREDSRGFFLESLGLDGIYTDDVPFGVQHQAPIR